jgi:NADH:ubiquinone oxidoreductase subunit F (NADH-binding)
MRMKGPPHMNCRVLEGDPHSVIEAWSSAYVCICYVCRAEYPVAVKTLKIAIQQARELGLLGKNIMGSGFDFDMEVRMGAGAFVCGEETALIASIEGKRGEPNPRPPSRSKACGTNPPTTITSRPMLIFRRSF